MLEEPKLVSALCVLVHPALHLAPCGTGMQPGPLRLNLEGNPGEEIDKEVNIGVCLKWDFSSGLETLGKLWPQLST